MDLKEGRGNPGRLPGGGHLVEVCQGQRTKLALIGWVLVFALPLLCTWVCSGGLPASMGEISALRRN